MVWTGDLQKLLALAVDPNVRLPGDTQDEPVSPAIGNPAAVLVPPIDTMWNNCTFTPSVQNGVLIHDFIKCDLIISLNNQSYPVFMDIFSLGCSRPGCSIYFLQPSTQPSDTYSFVYRPQYPTDFVSENVGTPAPFADRSIITDGFHYGKVFLGLAYTPATPSNLELGSDMKTESMTTDQSYYKCLGDCANRGVIQFVDDSDVF
eukprot:TRINITY_DN3787_c0_g1_i4.p1 TRINITY_DN3787_c0_g1~~TRINITY_DN3787_c0_g1_i4.p1  ORF type:complete len:204 (-),score=31.50 TRINITY_DN3787_c0_g1_i4:167-778(-)